MLTPRLVTPPSDIDPGAVSLEELKKHLREETNDYDDVIFALGAAATGYLDGWTGILGGVCLVEQTWSQAFDRFPWGVNRYSLDYGDCPLYGDYPFYGRNGYGHSNATHCGLRLSLGPLIEIVSIKYYDSSAVLQTLSSATYRILTDALGPMVTSIPDAATPWPSSVQSRPDAVTIEYKAGYGTVADVPEPIKTWIKRQVAEWFENREAGAATVDIGSITAYKRTFFA